MGLSLLGIKSQQQSSDLKKQLSETKKKQKNF